MYGNTVLVPLILLEQQRIILLTFFKFFRNPQKKEREYACLWQTSQKGLNSLSLSLSLSSSFLWPGTKPAKV